MDTDELQAQPLVRVEILADRIAGFLAMSPDSPRLVGADAAARWVAGRTTDRPIKQGSIVATSWSVREEMHMAAIMQGARLRRRRSPMLSARGPSSNGRPGSSRASPVG